ncbi:hypothetical protein AXE80_10095 [Wenyingzhuangia fucanilytica]|uniref:Histidine kinase domain-containing protein n=1 Tax=Wenyingzhuangia fucanilytica TaxID=1790137 RepID=A0A1B1Y760_9FLAO|nr:ATP-binding protein [Wenyingzhuangia fucanilytica]ANW96605.1 hypothetical protein AXE80_10095 [Wenyingzhuangia fucanilytica]
MDKTLKNELKKEFWKIGNTIFWSLNAVILLTIVLDITVLSQNWLDLVLLKFILLAFFYFTYNFFKKRYGTPDLLIHLILFSFNFLALTSIANSEIGNRVLYTSMLIALFIGFNTMAVWSIINSFIQYLLIISTFIVLFYLGYILDPFLILREGGYVFLLLGFISFFFPKVRRSIIIERIKLRLESEQKMKTLTTELSNIEEKYDLLEKKVVKKENEFKFLFQQISNDLNKIDNILLEVKENAPDEERHKIEDLDSLLHNLRNQSAIYFKPINLNTKNNSFLKDQVNVYDVYLKVTKLFKNQIEEKKLHVGDYLIGTDFFINANERMFSTIIYNILNFAIIFSETNDEIKVELNKVDDRIVFSVENTNQGLKTSEIENYFRDVEFVNYDYKKHSDSVKVGLRISKQLTEKMNGYFSYVSSEKLGYKLKIQFSTYK